MCHFWDVRRRDFPFSDSPPVDISEKGMLLNLVDVEAGHWVVGEQLLDEGAGVDAHVFGQVERTVAALLHDDFGVLSVVFVLEWYEPADHLTDQDADAPDVRFVGVADVGHHDLRSTIPWRATIGIRPVTFYIFHLFRESEIDDFDVPIVIN